MQMPRAMRGINRAFTNRLMGPVARYLPPLARVHHVGRKSGREYATPVLAFPTEGGVLTPLPYGTDTDWVLNLLSAGGGELEVSGKRHPVENPRVLSSRDAMPLVHAAVRPALRLLSLPGFLLLDRADA